MACPFMLPRELARRFFKPRAALAPAAAQQVALARPLRARPVRLRAVRPLGLAVVDGLADPRLLRGRPGGGRRSSRTRRSASGSAPSASSTSSASTVSPLEVKVRDPDVCARCTTHDCIRGTRDPEDRDHVLQRGCELAPLPAAQGGQHGLHLLPGLRLRLPARQRRHHHPAAGQRAVDRSAALRHRASSRSARTWRPWRSSSPSAPCSTPSAW